MRQMKWLFVMLTVAVVLCLGACGTTDVEHSGEEQTPDETESTGTDQAQYPLTVTDDSGAEVTIEREPERIISVLPSTTEIVFALGLGEKVVAVTDNDDYPAEVSEKESVGGMQLNVEKIVSLEPDLVLAGKLNGEVVQKLRDLDLTVVVAEGDTLEGIYESIALVGRVTNRTAETDDIVADMKADVSQVEQLLANIPEEDRVTVLNIMPELFTPGAGTLMNELVTLAGGSNGAANLFDGWGQLSSEKVVEINPDVMFGTDDNAGPQQVIRDHEAWADIKAVKNERIYELDSNLISRPGPRITEGLKQLFESFYPENAQENAA